MHAASGQEHNGHSPANEKNYTSVTTAYRAIALATVGAAVVRT
jgi:hypothetical protein